MTICCVQFDKNIHSLSSKMKLVKISENKSCARFFSISADLINNHQTRKYIKQNLAGRVKDSGRVHAVLNRPQKNEVGLFIYQTGANFLADRPTLLFYIVYFFSL